MSEMIPKKTCPRCGRTEVKWQKGCFILCAACGYSPYRGETWEEVIENWNNQPLVDCVRSMDECVSRKEEEILWLRRVIQEACMHAILKRNADTSNLDWCRQVNLLGGIHKSIRLRSKSVASILEGRTQVLMPVRFLGHYEHGRPTVDPQGVPIVEPWTIKSINETFPSKYGIGEIVKVRGYEVYLEIVNEQIEPIQNSLREQASEDGLGSSYKLNKWVHRIEFKLRSPKLNES